MGRKEELQAQFEARIINAHNASYAGMAIDGPVFRYGGREYPINTVSAEVVVGSSTSKSRSTATRIIGGGLVAGPGGMLLGGAAKKKTDTSKVYITVKLGDGSVHTISRPANEEARLRGFADKLESAVNRTWPINTPLGTTLDLDRSSTRPATPNTLGMQLICVIAVTLLFMTFIHWWALLVGLAGFALILFIDDRRTKALHRELDQHFPGWQAEQTRLAATKDDQMWDQARNKARDAD